MLSGLEVTSAGLEEAFLALTQENSKNDSHSNGMKTESVKEMQ